MEVARLGEFGVCMTTLDSSLTQNDRNTILRVDISSYMPRILSGCTLILLKMPFFL